MYLLRDLPLDRVVGALSADEVAEAAGRTSGAFFHHFGDMERYAAELLEHVDVMGSDDFMEGLEHVFAEVAPDDIPDLIRAGAEYVWACHDDDSEGPANSLLMLACHFGEQPLSPGGRTPGQVLGSSYWAVHLPKLAASYEVLMERWGRSFIEPFTAETFAALSAALEWGMWLLERGGVGRISPRLYADVIVALFVATTRPVTESYRFDDVEAVLLRRRQPLEIDRFTDDQWRLLGRSFEKGRVPMSAVADVLGLSVEKATALFGDADGAAALCSRAWLRGLEEAAGRKPTAPPSRRLADVLVELARSARANPVVSQAVLVQRSEATRTPPEEPERDIRLLVPLDVPVAEQLALVAPHDGDAGLLVDAVLLLASTRPTMAPAAMAEQVLRLAGTAPAA